ncbi:LysR family transcriptional regulator [Streptomyces kebangsaanensis]|uniref:LysR family transcriptional regulator n=1 Tax=Streptomyces kebangsaanensis TaxID=864058 RepID=UPI0009A0B6CA|nr:LysR family transcriptional regulator [Streptomyces kebangsaanensis]
MTASGATVDLEALHSFLAVAKHRSISKAAAGLYVTQPTMSQRLRRLEESLGFALFERDWTGVVLTHQGAYFLPYAAQLIRDLSNASAVLGRKGTSKPRSFAEVAGHPHKVMFGVDNWLSERSVRAVVSSALSSYGADEFRVTSRPATTLIDLLELNQLDAGLFYSTDPDYPFHTEVIGTEEMAVVHPPGTVLEETSAPALKELLSCYRFVLFDNPVLTHHARITTTLIETYEISCFHVVDDYRTMHALIRLGECITVVPAGAVLDDRGQRTTDLPSTPLPGLLPEISVTVGVSDAGRDHGVTEAFARSVAHFLHGDPPGTG